MCLDLREVFPAVCVEISGKCVGFACRRDVDRLAVILGPMIAPLASRAVDLVAAGYLAKSLSRPASPRKDGGSQDSGSELSGELPKASCRVCCSGSSNCRKGSTSSEDVPHGEGNNTHIRRVASDSWVLSTGCVSFLRLRCMSRRSRQQHLNQSCCKVAMIKTKPCT